MVVLAQAIDTLCSHREVLSKRAISPAAASAPSPARVASRDLPARSMTPKIAASFTLDFNKAFTADAMELVNVVKCGISATVIEQLARRMGLSKERLVVTLGLSHATVDRRAREDKALTPDESSRVLGLARLIGQVAVIVEESGNPLGFDPAAWVASWMETSVPALGGHRPGHFMDTAEGQSLVSQLVARMQSGAYS